MTTVIYIHGLGGSAEEAEHYKPLFKDADVIGFDYSAAYPWEAEDEFQEFLDDVTVTPGPVVLIANSIGAYFAMQSLSGGRINKSFLISPIVDMEGLILKMMARSGVKEAELKEKKEIITPSGEVLSWKYLCYARIHPTNWATPTEILYGAGDNLTDRDTITRFAARIGAKRTIMENGEHWFHTEEQMAFLDSWLTRGMKPEHK